LGLGFLDWIDRGIRGIGVVTAWLTVVSIAAYGALQMLDRKLHLGVSIYLPDLSTSLLFILIFLTFGYTYLRDGHVRVDVLRRHWSPRRIAWIELIGGLFVLLPLAAILTYYGWDGLMRTTRYAETQLWAQRIAGVIGPILLALAGVIVALRNIAFLAGKRAQGAPEQSSGLHSGE
jgi:TRAP-type mannitol/chloroaromatic compound transport system permease small subunit